VTLTDPLTADFLGFPAESGMKHGSVTIYRHPTPMPFAPKWLAIIEPKVVALGTEQQLKTLVDQPSGNGVAADFQLLEGTSQVAMAICPRNIVQQVERLAVNNVELPQLHQELNQFVAKGGRAVALQLSLTSDIEAAIVAQASDASKAADVQAALEAQVQAAREGVNAPAGPLNPVVAGLKPVMEKIQVVVAGDRVSATATIPRETIDGLGQMAAAMAGPALMSPSPSVPAGSPTAAP
jgi:hypothetical protein